MCSARGPEDGGGGGPGGGGGGGATWGMVAIVVSYGVRSSATKLLVTMIRNTTATSDSGLTRWPEPRCPAHAARVTVGGAHEACGNWIGTRARREQVAWEQPVRRFRESGDVRHAATQHHDVGVEHVDQRREGAAEPIVVSGQRCRRGRVAARCGAHDLAARYRETGALGG